MKVMVIGANGQLGSDIADVLANEQDVISITHDDGDISDFNSMQDIFDNNSPDYVINTAAMHNVENCEMDPLQAFKVNGIGVRNLALLCREGDIPFLHVSTDYVFDGNQNVPYVESDSARPLNVYGNTKLSGENFALNTWKKTAVLRVGGIYGANPCRAKGGLNFVRLMLKLAEERPEIRVVNDEIVTPTPTRAIARQIKAVMNKKGAGLYHATCQGHCSWYEFAKAIFEIAGKTPNLQKARPGEFPVKIKRPSYSVLFNQHLKDDGIDIMPDWKEGLEDYLAEEMSAAV